MANVLRNSQSLIRGMKILDFFTEEYPEWRVTELSGLIDGISKSCAWRYLNTLTELGLLERSDRSRIYRWVSSPVPISLESHRSFLKSSPKLSASLIRGLIILSCFDDGMELGVNQISEKIGISMSTTHRYLATLRSLGHLVQNPLTRKYRQVGTPSAVSDELQLRPSEKSLSLGRGVAVVNCFSSEDTLLGIKEIAELVGLGMSTTYRYVATAQAMGLVGQDPPHCRYRLTPEAPSITPEQIYKTAGGPRWSKSFARGFGIFSCLIDTERDVSCTEIVDRLGGSSPSTVHRYVATLVLLGLVRQNALTRYYRLNADQDALWLEHLKQRVKASVHQPALAIAA